MVASCSHPPSASAGAAPPRNGLAGGQRAGEPHLGHLGATLPAPSDKASRGAARTPPRAETGRAGSLQHNPAPPSTPANRLFIKRKQRHVFGKLFDQGQRGFERGGRWLSACPPPGRASAAKTWPACCPAGAAWGREPGKLPSRAGSEGAAPRQRQSLRGRAESSAWKQWEVTQERALRWQTMPFSKSCFCKTSLRQIPGKWPSDTEPS